MKLRALLAIILTALPCLTAVYAQPKVEWLSQIHNFGAFDEADGNVACTIKFVNIGDRPLSITAARATCGCTTPEYTRRPIEPGDTGSVKIVYNPTGRPGRFEKKVYIHTNTTPEKTTLIIRGTVIGSSNTVRSKYPVEAGPLRLRRNIVPFGDVSKGHTKTEFVDAYNTSADSVAPIWTDIPPYVRVASASKAIAPGDYTSFAISFNSADTPLYGLVTDSLSIIADPAHPDQKLGISLVAMVNEDFSSLTDRKRASAPKAEIIPAMIDCGIIENRDIPASYTVRISNSGPDPLIVRRVYTADPGIEVSAPAKNKIKKNKGADIVVKIYPDRIPGSLLNARLSVITNDPANPVIPIRIVGEIR